MFVNNVTRIQGFLSSATRNAVHLLLNKPSLVNNHPVIIRSLRTSRICLNNERKISATHKVDNLEKRFLVWTGKYKRIEDVPSLVPSDTMERSRNIMRIRIANIMMVLTLLGCLAMVWSGKRARDRGETLERQNYLWHKQYQEEEAAKKSQSN